MPDGGRLGEDEFVVRTAKDWGTSVKPLILTTQRLICPSDPGGRAAVLPLTDVRGVTLRKHAIGFSTIIIETADQGQGAVSGHINGPFMEGGISAIGGVEVGRAVWRGRGVDFGGGGLVKKKKR